MARPHDAASAARSHGPTPVAGFELRLDGAATVHHHTRSDGYTTADRRHLGAPVHESPLPREQ